MWEVVGTILIIATLPLAAFIAWRSTGVIRASSRSPAFLKAGAAGGRVVIAVILFPFIEVILLWLLLVAKGLFGG
jgi:hypothetical protein